MSITLLPTPNRSRRYAASYIDSLGRYITMEAVYLNATHAYDLTRGTAPERYDPATGAWTVLAEDDHPYQSFGTAIDPSNKIFRAAGQQISASNSFSSNFHIFDSIANTWSTVGSFPTTFQGRTNVAGFYDPVRGFFTGGGFSQGSSSQYRDWFLLSGSSLVAKATPPVIIGGVPVVDASGRAYFTNISAGDGRYYRYDPALDSWFTGAAGNAGGLYCIDQTNGFIYSLAATGGAGGSPVNGLLFRYTIASDTWTSLATFTTTSIPSPVVSFLVYHQPTTAVYMYGITSGQNQLSPVGDQNVRKYDPAVNSWSVTGDLATLGYFNYRPAFDGVGYYVGQRAINTASNQDAVNVVEYWIPGVTSIPRVRDSPVRLNLALSHARTQVMIVG